MKDGAGIRQVKYINSCKYRNYFYYEKYTYIFFSRKFIYLRPFLDSILF